MGLIYKIMSIGDWAEAQRTGIVPPAAIDCKDGYIHLSTEDQVLETARLHFAGRDDLVAAAYIAEDFGETLKWEASRGGALFPHLYASLPAAKATSVRRLMRLADGSYEFGDGPS